MTDFPPARKSAHSGETDAYTARERRELLRDVAGGGSGPVCPRCGTPCAVIHTRPRADVAYVRDRVIVRCPGCRRSVVADAEKAKAKRP